MPYMAADEKRKRRDDSTDNVSKKSSVSLHKDEKHGSHHRVESLRASNLRDSKNMSLTQALKAIHEQNRPKDNDVESNTSW